MAKDEANLLGVIGAILGIIASGITILQAVKTCPCDGNPLPFKLYCSSCGHQHFF